MTRMSRVESVQVTRERLLDAAEEVFAERGFAAASLDQIAEAASFTRGAVYANFDGKDDLFLAILDRWLDRQQADFEAMSAGDPSVGDLLKQLSKHQGNRFADRRQFLLLSEFRLYAIRHPEALPRLAEYDRRSARWYAAAISAVAERTGARIPGGADRLALAILALEHGISVLAHVDEEVDQHEFVAMLAEISQLLAPPRGQGLRG